MAKPRAGTIPKPGPAPIQQQQTLAPNRMQQLMLDVPLDDVLCMGTAKGTGKSFGVVFLVMRDARAIGENYHCLITRSTFQSLVELQTLLLKWLPVAFPGTTYNSSENTFRLGGKAAPFGTVELAYRASSPLEQVRALSRLQGRSKICLIHDEAGNDPSPDFFDQLQGVLRGPPGVPTRVIFLANPGGPGHAWLRQRFALPAGCPEPMRPRRFWSEDYQRFAVFATADASVNEHIDWEQYKRQVELMAGGDPALLAALLRGDWNVDLGGGAFFGHCWSPTRCRHMIRPGEINLRERSPRAFVSMDWGISAPSVAYLFLPEPPGVDAPKGSLMLLDECYMAASTLGGNRDWAKGSHLSSAQQAGVLIEWLDRWNLRPSDVKILADDAVFSSDGSHHGSTAGDFRAAGVQLSPAEKAKTSMVVGLAMLRNRMSASRKDYTSPWLLWSPACAGWEATVPGIPRHPRDPETIADGCSDHAADAARYGISWYEARWLVGNTNMNLW
jgi:hypothetical protein